MRAMRIPFAALLLVVSIASLTGCRRGLRARYQPTSAATLPRLTTQAVRIYEGDIDTMRSVNAKVVGSIDVTGFAFSSDADLAARASQIAASNGATHIILTNKRLEEVFARSHGYVHTTYHRDGSVTHTYEPPRDERVGAFPVGRFQALRVDPLLWSQLPDGLRPNGFGAVASSSSSASSASSVMPTAGGQIVYAACVAPRGIFLVHYTRRSGTCGDLPERLVRAEDYGHTTAECHGSWDEVGDGCRVEVKSECNAADGRGSWVTTGVETWARGQGRASGVLQMWLKRRDGTVACTGTYDVTYEPR